MSPTALPVLIVDDQSAIVRALEVLLDLNDIAHIQAATPKAALRIAADQTLGAVIQDMNFEPQETSGDEGVALFRGLREVQPGLPILVMTAWASLETAVDLVRDGAADYIEKPWSDEKLIATIRTLLRMRELEVENSQLRFERHRSREELASSYDLRGLVYESRAMHQVVQLAVNVAASEAPVLITGPNGSGKERIAEIVQANSHRSGRPFVRVNVGAIPEELMESELFGAEPGAYTGATKRREGRFETADGGTLFLDEIDALSLASQVKLLRVLQSGEFQRLGSSQSRTSDVRVISATNADLAEAIAAGRFREDLFFRLNVIELKVPGLELRRDDVLPLARFFLTRFQGAQATVELSSAAQDALRDYNWPGNVRELENRIQRATLVAGVGPIEPPHLDLGGAEPPGMELSVELSRDQEAEREQVVQALSAAAGNVSLAAERLGVSRQALYRRMTRLGIELERRPRV